MASSRALGVALVLLASVALIAILLATGTVSLGKQRPPQTTPAPSGTTPASPSPGPFARARGEEHGPYGVGNSNYVIFWIPCASAGDEGIATMLIYPKQPRYPEGAPVVVNVQGIITPVSSIMRPPNFDTHGVIWIYFVYPGGRSEGYASGGSYDYGGPACVEALYCVMQFAQGRLANGVGKKITDYVGYNVLTDNVGIYASSSGGNVVGMLLARHGSGLEGLKYVVFYETPVGDHYITGDLGRVGDDPDQRVDADGDGIPWDDARNLRYAEGSCNETSCVIDFSNLRYDPEVGFYLDNNGDGRPNFYGKFPRFSTDVDHGGALEEDEDFIFVAWDVTLGGKSLKVYSYEVTTAAWSRGLFNQVPPSVMRPEEAWSFWFERDISHHYDEISRNYPELKIMQIGFARDHVQASRDHPHIVVNYNAFRRRGHWVRLNPDRSYLEYVAGGKLSVRENAA
ncbi:MAG TPA: hypothetical protein ENG69_01155, partial [Candidatus Korarchaeota archaeon]|nr:hypothetical protein [Candidatus Korarchaeota archaeon]